MRIAKEAVEYRLGGKSLSEQQYTFFIQALKDEGITSIKEIEEVAKQLPNNTLTEREILDVVTSYRHIPSIIDKRFLDDINKLFISHKITNEDIRQKENTLVYKGRIFKNIPTRKEEVLLGILEELI